MSEHDILPVTVRILDKEYQVACRANEKQSLLDSARYLDQRMREIRNSGKVIGSDRIAVMAALNITHDLLQSQLQLNHSDHVESEKLKRLLDKLSLALNDTRQMEF